MTGAWRVRVRTYTPGDGYHESVLKVPAPDGQEAESIAAQVCFTAGAETVQIGSVESVESSGQGSCDAE